MLSVVVLNVFALSVTLLSVIVLFQCAECRHCTEFHFAECHLLSFILLSVIC
jgi:hypothetical protein